MKYCPFCGVDLPSGAFSFCPECGEKLYASDEATGDIEMPPVSEDTAEPETELNDSAATVSVDESADTEDAYDGYYDDIQPLDRDENSQQIDKGLIKKVCLLLGGVILIISLCVVVLILT